MIFGGAKPSRGLGLGKGSGGAESLRDFEGWILLRCRSVKYARAAVRIAQRFLWGSWSGPAGRADLGPAEVVAYLTGLLRDGRSPKTVSNHRIVLSRWFAFLVALGERGDNPARAVPLGRLAKRMARYLDDAEIVGVLDAAQSRAIWPEVMLALCSGLRLGEMSRLHWDDVHWDRRMIAVIQTKNGLPRMEPLSPPAMEALRRQREKLASLGCAGFVQVFPARRTYMHGFRYVDPIRSANSWRNLFLPVQAAIPKFTAGAKGCGRAWHLLRHTFASRLAQANVSDRRIARLLGHSDVRSVDVYAHLREEYDPAVELAAPPLGSSQPSAISGQPPADDWEI